MIGLMTIDKVNTQSRAAHLGAFYAAAFKTLHTLSISLEQNNTSNDFLSNLRRELGLNETENSSEAAIGKMATTGRHRKLADSDDSDDEAGPTGNVLTTAKASDLCPKPHRLIAQNGAFTSMEDLSTLSALDYIDLRGNNLTSVQGLSSNTRLKTLIVKQNNLSNVDHILKTDALQILNLSDNQFVSTDWLMRASFAPNLVALVARGNKLLALEGMSCLRKIETLVLSENQIEDLSPVAQLVSLTKLSVSKNSIRVIPPSIAQLHNLRELRLAHNRLALLPEKQFMARLSSLKILDIGHNRITNVDSLAACGGSLIQLNVAGNPVCAKQPNFNQHLQSICPRLEIIDGRRITGGRRKLRVNRQRLEAGMALEPERKFARPPSAYYIRKAEEQNGISNEKKMPTSPTPAHPTIANKRALEKEPQSDAGDVASREIEPPKKKMHVNIMMSDEEDGDAIDASHFVAMAKTKSVPLANVAKSKAQNAQGSRNGSRQKSKKELPRNRRQVVDFGSGGASKWEV